MAGKQGHRNFGYIRKLPSKRHQASYVGPDGNRHAAPFTFDTRLDAAEWLAAERRLIDARTWLAQRTLKPRTIAHYRSLIERLIVPKLGAVRVDKLTPPAVRAWWSQLDAATPTQNAHAYALLK